MPTFPSEDWLKEYVNRINESSEYREAAATWEGDISYVFEAEPDKGVPQELWAYLESERFIHPVMGKTVRRSKKYHAHDEGKSHKTGDIVRIRECKPISKLKRWEVIERSGEAEGKA